MSENMATAGNEKDLKPTPDRPQSPASAALELIDEGLPPWAKGLLDFLKRWQNVIYAIATVALLAWALLKFRARQRETADEEATTELAKAVTVDELRQLSEKYPDLKSTPLIRLKLANALAKDQRWEEALKEYEAIVKGWPDSLPAKLAKAQATTAEESKSWAGPGGILEKKLEDLRQEERDAEARESGRSTTGGPVISDKDLPLVEFSLSTRESFRVELDEDGAPNAVAQFMKLAQSTFYDGTYVYRVDAGKAAYLGDPSVEGTTAAQDTIPFESSALPAKAGAVALVRDLPAEGQPDSDALKNTASFRLVIVTAEDAPELAGKHVVIGYVAAGGLDVVRRLKAADKIGAVKILRRRGHDYLPKYNSK
jgi:cyclophilin family peptidyl-prolyl cis-trans isomerase